MSYLILLFLLELLLFLGAFTLTDRDILAPSTIMCAMFIVSTAFAIASASTWEIDYSLNSCAILISGIFLFLVTEVLVKTVSKKQKVTLLDDSLYGTSIQIRNWVLLSLVVLNAIVLFWYFIEIRRIVGNMSSIGLLFSSYRNLGVADLAGKTSERVNGILNFLLKIVKASGYIGVYVLINTKLFHVKAKKANNPLFLTMLCITSIIPNVMVASRGGLLMFLSYILIIYYILWHQKNGWNRSISWRVIRIGIVAIVLGIPVFYYSAFLMGRKNTINIFEYISTYIGGSIGLFDLYVKDPIPCNMFGEESLVSFLKILNTLGLSETSTSYNLESRYLGAIRSNVYTFFRRPLHDFGLLGMYIFTILVALLFSYIYYNKIKFKKRTFKTDCWVLVYGYLYYWIFVSSILQYSVSYVSAGCVMTIAIIIVLYWLLIKVRIILGRR